MLAEQGLLVPVGGVLIAALIYLDRLDSSRALRLWTWGFVFLYAAGLVSALAPPAWRAPGMALLNPMFVVLMAGGAIAFSGRPLPGWLIPSGVGFALLRVTLSQLGLTTPANVATMGFELPLFAAAGVLVWQSAYERRGAGIAEQLLGPCFLLMGGLNFATTLTRLRTGDASSLTLYWLGITCVMALLQILAGFERIHHVQEGRSRELDAQRRMLRAVLETAPLAILLQDDDGHLLMANHSAVARLGLSDALLPDGAETDAVLAQRNREFRQLAPLGAALDRVDEDRNLVIHDLEVETGQSHGETLQFFSSPVLSDMGERLGRVWMCRDVTNEKELARQLRQAQKLETLGTLAGGVAHDFNNQLTTILGNAQLIGDEMPEGYDLAREALTDLERAADHCAELTRGLLSFARRVPVVARPMRIEPVLEEVEGLLRAMIPSSIALDIDVGEPTWTLQADSVQLQQLIVNLAVNARDAIPGTGAIRIGVRNRTVTALAPAIGTPRPGRYVEIEVHDTGEGISPKCRERIFDPFFTTKGVGQGTGLGLAIVYGIVRSHNGWIEVDSQPGSTTFRICLPALSDALPQEAPPEATIELRHDAGCVLAVDDEPGVLRLIRHTLGRLGYRVLEASSGDEAIELMATHAGEVDLLVLDYAMPGRDGITTLFELRRLSPDLPVLLASGLTERLAEIETTPHLRLLPKPFRPDDLAAAVHELLRQRSAVDG